MTKNEIVQKLQKALDNAEKVFEEENIMYAGARAFGHLEAHIEFIIDELKGERR